MSVWCYKIKRKGKTKEIMLDFYHNLNISSGIMLHDIESDKTLTSCGVAGGNNLRIFNVN